MKNKMRHKPFEVTIGRVFDWFHEVGKISRGTSRYLGNDSSDYTSKAEEYVGRELGFTRQGRGFSYNPPKPSHEALVEAIALCIRLMRDKLERESNEEEKR